MPAPSTKSSPKEITCGNAILHLPPPPPHHHQRVRRTLKPSYQLVSHPMNLNLASVRDNAAPLATFLELFDHEHALGRYPMDSFATSALISWKDISCSRDFKLGNQRPGNGLYSRKLQEECVICSWISSKDKPRSTTFFCFYLVNTRKLHALRGKSHKKRPLRKPHKPASHSCYGRPAGRHIKIII